MRQWGLAFIRSRKASLAACVLAAAGLFTACLVTSKVDYDEAFIPSEVVRDLPRLGEFATVPPKPDEECMDRNGYMRFGYRVSDLNLQEELRLQIVVNHERFDGDVVPANGKRDRPGQDFCVPRSLLMQPCNLVEALISSEFAPQRNRPYDAPNGDLSSVHWWVIGEPTDNPAASYLDCPDDVRDAGEP